MKHIRGQVMIEYILLLAIILTFVTVSLSVFNPPIGERLYQKIIPPLQYAYQYGDARVRGYDDPDGPKLHPLIQENGTENFRIIYFVP